MKLSAFYGIVLSVLMFSSPVLAVSDVERDIEALREDVKVLQRKLYRGVESEAKAVSTANSEVQQKIGEHDEVVRDVNGRMDQIEYKIKELGDKLDRMNRDYEIRFRLLEGKNIPDNLSSKSVEMPTVYSAPIATGAARAVVGDAIQGDDLAPIEGTDIAPQPVVDEDNDGPQALIPGIKDEPVESAPAEEKKLSAEEVYASGMQALNEALYDKAESAFKLVLQEYPNDKLAGNAQYWLGEVYYKQNDFDKAKMAFKAGYEKYHDGNKAPDSLFKLGMTLKSQKDAKSACIVFTSFAAEFPKANAELSAKVQNEIKKTGCK